MVGLITLSFFIFDALNSEKTNQIRRVMEERFSCNLENRKAFVKDVIITAVEDRAAAKEVPDSNSSNQPSGAEDEHNGDSDMSDGDAIIGAVAAAHAASAAVATATLASLSGTDDDDDDGEDDDGETNEHAFDKSSSESEADGNDAAQLPVLPALDDTGEDSSASNSSETDDGAEEKSQSSPASLMPRPKARSTSARRALALAKLKRTVRGARSAAAAAAEGRMSNSEDSSDDNADSGAADSNSAKKMSYRRKKQQKLTSGGGSGEGRASGDDQGKDSVMSELDDNSRTSSSDSGSKGSAGSSGFSSGGSGKRRAKAKKTAKKAGAAAKRKLNAGKGKRGKKKTAGGAAGDKDDLSGLVDSDEEFANGPAASRDRAAKAAAKAVVQEELDVSLIRNRWVNTRHGGVKTARLVFVFLPVVHFRATSRRHGAGVLY